MGVEEVGKSSLSKVIIVVSGKLRGFKDRFKLLTIFAGELGINVNFNKFLLYGVHAAL